MKKPPLSAPAISPTDALQVSGSDTVALLVSSFDPPAMEYLSVLKLLGRMAGIRQAWMTPVYGGEDVGQACNVLASILSGQGFQVGVCSLGSDAKLSFPDDVFEHCRKKLKYLSLRMAYIASEYPQRVPKEDDIVVIPMGFEAKPCKSFIADRFPIIRHPVRGSLLDAVKKVASQR